MIRIAARSARPVRRAWPDSASGLSTPAVSACLPIGAAWPASALGGALGGLADQLGADLQIDRHILAGVDSLAQIASQVSKASTQPRTAYS